MYDEILKGLIEKIDNKGQIEANTSVEYFYLLGQVLSAVFIKIGGFDKYREEFNYLTNPYIPRSIMDIRKRVLNFLRNIKSRLNIDNDKIKELYEILFEFKINSNPSNLRELEDAFYEGLYAENFIIRNNLLG